VTTGEPFQAAPEEAANGVNGRRRGGGTFGAVLFPIAAKGFAPSRFWTLPLWFEGDRPGSERNPGGPVRTPNVSRKNSQTLTPRTANGLTGRSRPDPGRHLELGPGSSQVESLFPARQRPGREAKAAVGTSPGAGPCRLATTPPFAPLSSASAS